MYNSPTHQRGVFLIILISSILVISLALIIISLVHYFSRQERDIKIYSDYSVTEITKVLSQNQVIRFELPFKIILKIKGTDRIIQGGEYEFYKNLSYSETLEILESAPRVENYKMTIPEGYTVGEIANLLEEKTLITKSNFLKEAGKNNYSKDFLKDNPTNSLEGYLFPKTYIFSPSTSAHSLIQMMLDQFREEIARLDFNTTKGKSYNLHQIVTIGSLVEEEVKIPQERVLVSAVIYNRLDKGMKLEIDATVQYVLPQRKNKLTYADLQIKSAYNTYLHKGLPPGPISNPGIDSLKAVLNPANVDYLYYVLVDEKKGRHAFTNSYEEFLKLKSQSE